MSCELTTRDLDGMATILHQLVDLEAQTGGYTESGNAYQTDFDLRIRYENRTNVNLTTQAMSICANAPTILALVLRKVLAANGHESDSEYGMEAVL